MRKSGWGAAFIAVGIIAGPVGCADEAPAPIVAGSSTGVGSSSGEESSSGEPVAGPPVSLVRAEAWDLTPTDDDPFGDERPGFVQCELGWDVETGAFEVSTDLCKYGSFTQRSLAEIEQGDRLELVILHDALYFEQPATAHVAIAIGTEIAWEIELPIPAEAAQLRPTWTAPADVPVGTDVHFHLHNHGTNNYRLIDLTVVSP